ncbi:ZIP family metal transporter [Paenibacillus sp. GCM10023252]|uniref:ZIP family metal transporter n=1 Tax=Paenibacillus sp. GCM10023252 TaxID=3252649 RepID=UPI0036236168
MLYALLWGAISGSAVLIGAICSILTSIPTRIVGYIMAYGTGILIGATAYELLGESAAEGGLLYTAAGFLAGAMVFTAVDLYLSHKGGSRRKRSSHHSSPPASAPAAAAEAHKPQSGLTIFAGTVLDAIPESIMIGASLLAQGSVSWLLVISVFLSNIPEGLSSTAGLLSGGYSKRRIMLMWGSVLVISALASFGGYTLLDQASSGVKAMIAAFAGGAIVAMVSSTMMPEAYQEGGPVVGLLASAGLLSALVLDYYSM